MRWIILLATLTAIAFSVLTRSPGWLALSLLATLVGLIATVFAFAHNRIGHSARTEEMNPFELEQLRKRMREQAKENDKPS